MKFLPYIGLPLVLSAVALPASAQDIEKSWYEVEIIVFEHLSPDALYQEQWPTQSGTPSSANIIELIETTIDKRESANAENDPVNITPVGAEMPKGAELTDQITAQPQDESYRLLSADQFQLSAEYEKLVESAKHSPLIHLAWRQVVPDRNTPDVIHITNGLAQLMTPDTLVDDAIDAFIPASNNNYLSFGNLDLDMSLESEALTIPAIDGVIMLGRGRYLHVETDLLYQHPDFLKNQFSEAKSVEYSTPDEDTINTELGGAANQELISESAYNLPETVRLQGTLRMRSNELHYLDHPLVGMLILFTPYTPPQVELPEGATTTSGIQIQP